MNNVLENAIDSYNAVFLWGTGQGDDKCSICDVNYTLKCKMLDSIQLTDGYIGGFIESLDNVNYENRIWWKYVKTEKEEYFFYPELTGVSGDKEVASIADMMKELRISRCPEPQKENTYMEQITSAVLFQTGKKEPLANSKFSPSLIVDMWFYINQNERRIEFLQNINKILCASNLALMHKFLQDMLEVMQSGRLTLEDKKELYKAVRAFVDSTETMARELACLPKGQSGENVGAEAKVLQEMQKMAVHLNNAYNKQMKNLYTISSHKKRFALKIENYIMHAQIWTRDKKMRGHTIYTYLENMEKEIADVL